MEVKNKSLVFHFPEETEAKTAFAILKKQGLKLDSQDMEDDSMDMESASSSTAISTIRVTQAALAPDVQDRLVNLEKKYISLEQKVDTTAATTASTAQLLGHIAQHLGVPQLEGTPSVEGEYHKELPEPKKQKPG